MTTATAEQIELFATDGAQVKARARRTDPVTSHQAAQGMNKTGATGAQAAQVLQAVKQWPGSTSAEIAARMNADRVMPARRLPDLEKKGAVEKGASKIRSITGNPSITWFPNQKENGK